jgi:hypothetical protein
MATFFFSFPSLHFASAPCRRQVRPGNARHAWRDTARTCAPARRGGSASRRPEEGGTRGRAQVRGAPHRLAQRRRKKTDAPTPPRPLVTAAHPTDRWRAVACTRPKRVGMAEEGWGAASAAAFVSFRRRRRRLLSPRPVGVATPPGPSPSLPPSPSAGGAHGRPGTAGRPWRTWRRPSWSRRPCRRPGCPVLFWWCFFFLARQGIGARYDVVAHGWVFSLPPPRPASPLYPARPRQECARARQLALAPLPDRPFAPLPDMVEKLFRGEVKRVDDGGEG